MPIAPFQTFDGQLMGKQQPVGQYYVMVVSHVFGSCSCTLYGCHDEACEGRVRAYFVWTLGLESLGSQ